MSFVIGDRFNSRTKSQREKRERRGFGRRKEEDCLRRDSTLLVLTGDRWIHFSTCHVMSLAFGLSVNSNGRNVDVGSLICGHVSGSALI